MALYKFTYLLTNIVHTGILIFNIVDYQARTCLLK